MHLLNPCSSPHLRPPLNVILLKDFYNFAGLTKVNYTQLVQLHEKYGDRLSILAFPCNQFGHQEPGSNSEIKAFAEEYGVKFDMFSKVNVNGDDAHPIWSYLKSEKGSIFGRFIKWNFSKFIVDKKGTPVSRFSSKTDPIPQVEKELLKHM